jgi:hypothetical protein
MQNVQTRSFSAASEIFSTFASDNPLIVVRLCEMNSYNQMFRCSEYERMCKQTGAITRKSTSAHYATNISRKAE